MFNQYGLILVWIGFMALLQGSFYRKEYNKLVSNYEWRIKPLFAFIVLVPLIWMAANRGWFADTSVYIISYRLMPKSFAEISGYISQITKDKGFAWVSAIMHCILGNNYFLYLLILALFQGVSLTVFFRKYSCNYVFSVFLFIASTDYISWMFNGLRQFMAVTIILFTVPWIIQKKYVLTILTILIASTMHQSALLMIPFVIIAQGEAWNKKTLFFMIGALIAVSFVGQFTNILNEVLQNTQYVNMVSDYTSWNDDGTNPIRVLVYSVPAIIAYLKRREIKMKGNRLISFCVNMSVISMGLYVVSMVTSGIFLGRLPIYCSLFGYILLPWMLKHTFRRKSRELIYGVAVVCYLGFYYYSMHFQFGLI